jgi:predicted NBD/HSP70 family sugar kinase
MSDALGDLRRMHQRLIFDRLRTGGPASRAHLAKLTGLSPPTVGKVADDMIAAGLIEEIDRMPALAAAGDPPGEPVVGRPSRPLRVNATTPRVVCIQLGVRHTRIAALPVAGPMDERWPHRFVTPRSPRTWLRRLAEVVPRLGVKTPWAVAFSVPGLVDEDAGRVLLCPNLHWAARTDLVELLKATWSCPVMLVQEIRVLASGHLAARPADRDFLLVDFGDGVGAAAVIGGRPYRGALPQAGELGHTPIAGNTLPCGCGGIGCVETIVSRGGLLQAFSKATRRRPTWPALIRHIERHAIEPWLQAAMAAIGITIAGALNVMGLRRVIITGALTELPAEVIAELSSHVRRAAMWSRFGEVTCEAAPRRRAAGLIAATIDRLLLPSPQSAAFASSDRMEPSRWISAN